jgi:hypothetical protein
MSPSDDDERTDWLAEYVMLTANQLREAFTHAFAVIVPHKDISLPEGIPEMSTILDLKEEDTPAICMIHGGYQDYICYEHPLVKEEMSVELLILWTRYSAFRLERPNLINYIQQLEEDPNTDKAELDHLYQTFEKGEKKIEEIRAQYLETQQKMRDDAYRKKQLKMQAYAEKHDSQIDDTETIFADEL